MNRFFFILLTTCMATWTVAQKKTIDSLQALIKSGKDDANKIAHLNSLASLYIQAKKYKDAERQLVISLSLAEKVGLLDKIKVAQYDLSELYKRTNQPARELEHFKKYISIRDSILNQEKRAAIATESDLRGKEARANSEKNQFVIIGTVAGAILSLFLSILFAAKLLKTNRANKRMTEEQAPIRTLNEELQRRKTELEELMANQKQIIEQQKSNLEKYSPIINMDGELSKKKNELAIILSEFETNLTKHQQLQKEVNLLEESLENIDYGFYKPHYPFKASSEFKIELEKTTDEQKEMIKNESAAICNTEWTVGGSSTEGKRMTKQMSKLMLRAFNGEADSAIAKVSWSNVVTMEARIAKAHETINKFGNTMQISISDKYKDLKLKELYLNFELEEKQYKEKEEQRKLKEQMREEEKAQREIDKAMKEAQDEEMRYEKALERARQDIDSANGKELDELNEKIRLLEGKLQNAHENKQRAISRAQLTKSGYVYIISNIGSFGEHVYKIGMTRRLDPHDRVNELGDASVPFDFDVHGLIYSDNAPELESHLHGRFEIKRVNLVNHRTEFFRITIDEIEAVVKELNLKVQLTRIVPAKEYRATLSLIEANSRGARA